MFTDATPHNVESVYGSAVSDEQGTPHDQERIDRALENARETVRAEQEARTALEAAIDARAEANSELVEAAHRAMSFNDMARAIGLNPSTFLSDTKDARRKMRARKPK